MRRIGRAYEKSLEYKVWQRTEELRAAQSEIVDKARLVTIGQTASMLTHEMRNPLASIKLALSAVITHDQLVDKDKKKVGIALREVGRLDELLRQTLDYVRPVRLSPSHIHFDRLLDHSISVVESLAEQQNLRIDRNRCDACPPIRVDQSLMEQALLNLLKNAVEASPDGGHIQVDLRFESPYLCFSIQNAGETIPPNVMERVFEPFFTTKPTGTGLGLPLVKRVVEQHRGEVAISTTPEFETRVTLRFPVVQMAVH